MNVVNTSNSGKTSQIPKVQVVNSPDPEVIDYVSNRMRHLEEPQIHMHMHSPPKFAEPRSNPRTEILLLDQSPNFSFTGASPNLNKKEKNKRSFNLRFDYKKISI